MASEQPSLKQAEFREAFLANEQQVRIDSGKLACALVFFLMPFGVILDYFVYKDEHLWEFLRLRLLCSVLIGGVWLLHDAPIARKHYPVVGLPIVILPALFITWMVYWAFDPTAMDYDQARRNAAPYYAGLNLIMLAVSAVGHWSMLETFLAVASVILMYLVASVARGIDAFSPGIFFNNLYFLVLTGLTVVCGNYLFNRLRFSEFVLRLEVDKNRKELATQNQVLESTIEQLQEAQTQLVQPSASSRKPRRNWCRPRSWPRSVA